MIDVRGVHHLGLTVGDLAASCDYFTSAGYAIADRLTVTGADGAIGNGLTEATLEIAFVSAPTLTLELIQFEPADPRRVIESDAAFGSVPAWAPVTPAVDPDGRPMVAGASPCELQVTSSNPTETLRLFGALGFVADGDAWTRGHGVRLEVIEVAPGRAIPANAPGRVHVCCQVGDMSTACAELAEQGFELVSPPRVHADLAWVFVAHPGGPGVELLSIGTM